jgi:hypothetical protein
MKIGRTHREDVKEQLRDRVERHCTRAAQYRGIEVCAADKNTSRETSAHRQETSITRTITFVYPPLSPIISISPIALLALQPQKYKYKYLNLLSIEVWTWILRTCGLLFCCRIILDCRFNCLISRYPPLDRDIEREVSGRTSPRGYATPNLASAR